MPSSSWRQAAQQLSEIDRLIDAGQIRPMVDAPLAQARQAYEHKATRGKVG